MSKKQLKKHKDFLRKEAQRKKAAKEKADARALARKREEENDEDEDEDDAGVGSKEEEAAEEPAPAPARAPTPAPAAEVDDEAVGRLTARMEDLESRIRVRKRGGEVGRRRHIGRATGPAGAGGGVQVAHGTCILTVLR